MTSAATSTRFTRHWCCTYPIVGTRRNLVLWLESAVEQMIALDGDSLALELLLGDALNL